LSTEAFPEPLMPVMMTNSAGVSCALRVRAFLAFPVAFSRFEDPGDFRRIMHWIVALQRFDLNQPRSGR
jgi:hypothetical protein